MALHKKNSLNIHGLPTHINRPSLNKVTLRQKMQMAQHTGLRNRYGVKITLPKEPWIDDKEDDGKGP